MSHPIAYIEPSRIVAGETVKWLTQLADYPASEGWVLTTTLVSAAQRYVITSTASEDDHLSVAAAATTAGWVAADYALRSQVALAGEVYTVRESTVTVAPSFASAIDARSNARRALDAINAVLVGRADSAVADYTINGRSARYTPVPELLRLRSHFQVEVMREDAETRAAQGLEPAGRIAVRWGY